MTPDTQRAMPSTYRQVARIRTIAAKGGCLTCGGAGASVPLDEASLSDYCDCVLEQLLTEDDFMRLADGEITVEAADA